ncbi:M56 family metallopeptidase [Dokdonella soli]|uniref:Peptidase M56 domain-containing protein n=1 Tax=Dokdonella soli TaxID=529810 RepID=A0ABN1IM83_9GAMM
MDTLWNAQYAIAPAFANALLNSLWQDALLALLATASFSVLERRSAALRHVVGMVFLLAMVVAPFLSFAISWEEPGTTLNIGFLPAVSGPRLNATTGVFLQESNGVAVAMSLLWLLGAALMLVRQLGGLRLIRTLDRQAFHELPPVWQRRVQALQQVLGISRTVAVRLADNVVSPFSARFFRPVIWLPVSMLTQLAPDQVEALLAHELAHIRRADWLWNGLQCVAESLLFFHPAAWWLSRRIRQEREHACDDLAVGANGNAIALAEALAALERQRLPFPQLVLAAHGGSLMQRITRLLSGPPSRPRWRVPVGLFVLLCSGTLLAAGIVLPNHKLPNLKIESSTDGALAPGDFRAITADGLDKRRYYRISMDGQDRPIEIYTEDQQAKPIDGKVRTWLSEVTKLSAPPEMPIMPVMPEGLFDKVTSDARVTAMLGSPIEVSADSVHGNLDVWGADNSSGEAGLTVIVSGPKGRARVSFSGERHDGVWQVSTLSINPAVGAAQ